VQKSTHVRNCSGVFAAMQQVACFKLQKSCKASPENPFTIAAKREA
jgi:hypothetical protein